MEKWKNSHISSTQSVNTTPFCAHTQALVPGHPVDSPIEFMLSSEPHPCYNLGTGDGLCLLEEGRDWLILWGVLLNKTDSLQILDLSLEITVSDETLGRHRNYCVV